ncbi:MAG TPA: hypothetical protein VGK32_14855 [Vicinamibacterales bacterium]|jgi:hypothetical protein
MATKKWIPIVVGIVIFAAIVGVGVVGGLIYVVRQQVHVQTMSAAGGEDDFNKAVARFEGQKPFIELPGDDSDAATVVHREMETHETGSVKTIQVRIWLREERRLVRLELPFWLMRLGGNKPMKINTDASATGAITLSVTPEEVDRRGPGLLVRHESRRGERLLVWSE